MTILAPRRKRFRFRIVQGKAIIGDPDGKKAPGRTDGALADKWYRARLPGDPPDWQGDIIDTDEDLRRLDQPGMPPKFVPLDEDYGVNPFLTQPAPGELQEDFERRMKRLAAGETGGGLPPVATVSPAPPKAKPDIKNMNTKQLIQHAQKEGIDLKGATAHEAILKIVEAFAAE